MSAISWGTLLGLLALGAEWGLRWLLNSFETNKEKKILRDIAIKELIKAKKDRDPVRITMARVRLKNLR